MMRNNTTKSLLYNGRPEPTPTFTDSVRTALANLPEKKKKPVAARWLPKFAIAVAAVAVAGFLAMHFDVLGQLFHPAPAQNQFAGMPSLSDPRLAGTKIAPYKNNGMSEWISYACLDDGVLYIIVTADPVPKDGRVYMQDATVKVDSVSYHLRGDITNSGALGQGFPAGRITGKTERVTVEGFIESYAPIPDSAWPTLSPDGRIPADWKQPYSDPGTRVATFHHEFNVDVQGTERKIKVAGSGEISNTGEVRLESVYETRDLLTFVFSVKDDAAGDLSAYIDRNKYADPCNVFNYDRNSDTISYTGLFTLKGTVTDINALPADQDPVFSKYQSRLTRNADGTMTLTVYVNATDVDLKQGVTFGTLDIAADNTQAKTLNLKYYFVKQTGK